MWFNVEVVSTTNYWVEDYGILRPDCTRYIPPESFLGEYVSMARKNISGISQWQVRNEKSGSDFLNFLEKENVFVGKSYLEWWNVLYTSVNWCPWAIVWDESVEYSLKSMDLEDTPENRNIVKRQMASDLWIDYEQLTLIPQIDFHIDMIYRPLQDGSIAVPDYVSWYEMFSKFVPDIFANKQNYLNWLDQMKKEAEWVLQNAEEQLKKWWYEVKKVPSFTIPKEKYASLWLNMVQNYRFCDPIINYMNWVWWTSKDGTMYYMTNTSTFPELDDAMKNVFIDLGIDSVCFLDTQKYLNDNWAFDCLTQEL